MPDIGIVHGWLQSEDEQEAAAVLLGKLAGGDVTSAREIVSKGGISLLAGVVGGVSSGNRRCAQEAIQVVAALRLRQPEELDAVAKHAGLLHGLTDLATRCFPYTSTHV